MRTATTTPSKKPVAKKPTEPTKPGRLARDILRKAALIRKELNGRPFK